MSRRWVRERIKRERKYQEVFKSFIDDIIRIFRDRITIILYGSRAGGDYHIGSDYDIIVIAEDYPVDNIFERMSYIRRLSGYRINIHIIPLTIDEFKSSFKERSIIVREAILNGRVIYDGLGLSRDINYYKKILKGR